MRYQYKVNYENTITPSTLELVVPENDFISSKTDTKGILTYANALFIKYSGYKEVELLGQPHHIMMPSRYASRYLQTNVGHITK